MGSIRRNRRTFGTTGALATAVLVAAGAAADDPVPADNPLLLSSTYLGGNGDDFASAAAVGPDGALWVVTASGSTDIPGAIRVPGTASGIDALVLRLDPATRAVLSSAWIGGATAASGSNGDFPVALAFDAAGNAYVAGSTLARDFPATTRIGPALTSGGGMDVFLARVRRDGTGFDWSVLLGGSSMDQARGLCITADGDPVLVGTTMSPDFPLVAASDSSIGGDRDAFVARVRSDGSGLVFSTYVGGNSFEDGDAVAELPDGGFVVAGVTESKDLTTRSNVFADPSHRPTRPGFLAEIGPAGKPLRRAALLGATTVGSIWVEPGGTLLLAAEAHEPDVRVPSAPHGDPTYGDALLLRLDSATWGVVGGAFFGGSGWERAISAHPAPDGTIWLTGSTQSDDLPAPGGVRFRREADEDAFVAAFDPADFEVDFATYLGGSGTDRDEFVAAGADGSAWVLGSTYSPDFLQRDPVQARGSGSDLVLTHLRAGDPAARPGMPQGFSVVPADATSVRLSWTAGAGAPETGFAIDRAELGRFVRVAVVPAGTTAWTDASVLPDRGYTYSVQAVNADGGSPPTRDVRVLTPGSVDLRIDWGRNRFDRHGAPLLFRLEGALAPVGGGSAPDVRRDGLGLVFFTSDGSVHALDIAPDDRRWRWSDGRLRWRKGRTQLDFTPSTGNFALRLLDFGLRAEPGESVAVRVTSGTHAATASSVWRTVFRHGLGTP